MILYENDKIKIAISERHEGSMRLHDVQAIDQEALDNRNRFLASIGLDKNSFAGCRLEHGNLVADIGPMSSGTEFSSCVCDALVTPQPGVVLGITAADCFPVFLHNESNGKITVIHAGWKGILAGVIENAVMHTTGFSHGKTIGNIRAYIGPGIRECHFEVGQDVLYRFEENERYGDDHVSLPIAITRRLNKFGIPVTDCGLCTFCEESHDGQPRFYSFRREKFDPLKTMLAVIVRKS